VKTVWLIAAAKFVLYPTFYFVVLLGSIYVTFPWERVKDRIEGEFQKTQAAKGAEAWRLEIGSLDGYWLTGVELQGAKIVIPPDAEDPKTTTTKLGKVGSRGPLASVTAKKAVDDGASAEEDPTKAKDEKKAKEKKPRESTILVEHAHARVRILPLMIGRVRLDFGAEVFGGEVRGTVPVGGGDLTVEAENVDLGQVAPLAETVGIPLKGIANAHLELSAPSGKWSKATGSFTMTVADMIVGDGKAKLRGLKPLPPAALGTLEIEAKAENGTLKIEKFGAATRDLEVAGGGTVKLKDSFEGSTADLYLRFGFSDDYKNKNEDTKTLFVDDGPFPAMVNLDAKLKKAHRPDGMWGFHVHGRLGRLRYDPTTLDGPRGTKSTTDATAAKKKASATDEEEDEKPKFKAPTTPPPRQREIPVADPRSDGARDPRADSAGPAEPLPVAQPDAVEPGPAAQPEVVEPPPAPAGAPAPDQAPAPDSVPTP
jgi:type II secretion system protein N